MKRPFRSAIPCALLGVGLLFLGLACEDDPSTDLDTLDEFGNHPNPSLPPPSTETALDIQSSATAVTVAGQRISLRVYGGSAPYRWSVARADRGRIVEVTPGTGDTATYEATTVSPNTVQARDSAGRSLAVDFTASTPTLTVYPSLVTLEAAETNGVPWSILNQIIVFRVSGGVPPYGTWVASAPGMGIIVSQRVDMAWYQVKTEVLGDNFITITDSAGAVKDAKVTTKYNDGN